MTNAKHTPTPWTFTNQTTDERPWCVITIKDATDDVVIQREYHINDAQKEEANAAYIVKAVNCHEQLVKALKWAEPLIAEWFNQKPHCQDTSGLSLIRAALAAAEAQ